MSKLPKQLYVLIAAAVVLFYLLRQLERQTSPDEASLLEAELILGIPMIPNLEGWSPELLTALKEVHQDLSDEKSQFESLAALGQLYFINGFMGQARQCFEAMSKIEPKEVRWPYFLGMISLDYQDRGFAIEAFSASLLLDEEYPNIRYNLGQAYLGAGAILDSVDAFESLLSVEGWRGWAHFGLAEGLILEERYGEALNELELAIGEIPDVRKFYIEKEEVALFSGKALEAKHARVEIERLPYDKRPYDIWTQELWHQCFDTFGLLRLASAEEFEGHCERAARILERGSKIDRENIEIREALERVNSKIAADR